jgi:mitochondrial enoyl-[acyl-carrier protein] reductase / trans-2-enoyl-CoA reductase
VRALQFQMPGEPRLALELVELPEPEPSVGELLVEVLASPISPMDRLALRGLYPLHLPRGGVPGTQGVARVLALGPGVREPAPGAHVLLPVRCGAWRERLTVAASSVVVLPPDRDPAEACTLRIEALTAAVLLEGLERGEWFIHSPGAGSVGRHLTPLGRMRGFRSIALVGSREPIADLWGLGADHVLVREPGLASRLFDLDLPQPRLAFDGSGGATSELLGSCLRVGGELVVYGAASRTPPQLSVEQLVFRDLRMRGFWLHRWAQTVDPEAGENPTLRTTLEALAEVDLREHVVARFDLDSWPAAFEQAELPGARGRVVFTPTA